jgi:hypothetical protein
MMDCLAFDPDIAVIVAAIRERKMRRMQATYFPARRKRKPRFCVTTTLRLCPRQRAKKYKTS